MNGLQQQHGVLSAMCARTFYRAVDLVAPDRPVRAVRHALVRLERGGMVEGTHQRGLPHKVWITKQFGMDLETVDATRG